MISFYEAVAPAVQQQIPGAVVPQVQPQQPQPAQVPTQPVITAQQPVANAGQQQSTNISAQQTINSTVGQQPETPNWKKYLKYAGLVGGAIAGGTLLHDIYHKGGLSNWVNDRFGDLSSKFSNGSNFLGMVGFGNNETDTADNNNKVIELSKVEAEEVPDQQSKPIGSTRSTGLINANYTPPMRGAPPLDHQWGASGRIGNGGGTYFRHMPANQPFESASLVKVLGQDGRLHYAQRGYVDNSYPIETVDEIGYAPQVNVVKSNVSNGRYHTIPSNPIAKDGMY